MSKILTALNIGILVVAAGCGAGTQGSTEEANPFTIHESAVSLAGSYVSPTETLRFSAHVAADGLVSRLEGANWAIDYRRAENGAVSIDGRDYVLNQADLDAIRGLVLQVNNLQSAEPATQFFGGVLAHLSDAAPGYVVSRFTTGAEAGTGYSNANESKCVYWGRTYTYYIDWHKGFIPKSKTANHTVVNGNNCRGRCGADCNGPGPINVEKWTMDCLEHDLCVDLHGNGSIYCNDEWLDAADDFSNMTWSWQCSGEP